MRGNLPLLEQGLSPRVNPVMQGSSSSTKVYPRVCGGTRSLRLLIAPTGLSPRVRGNLLAGLPVTAVNQLGSIPACAGEPPCGILSGQSSLGRSIPACAGEPSNAVKDIHTE